VAAEVITGADKVRAALRRYEFGLADETKSEVTKALIPVTNKARGYATAPRGLSSWFKPSNGSFPQANIFDMRRGIVSNADPSKPNSKGWTNIARIENTSRAGSIFETAGRKNKNGRAAFQTILGAQYGTYGTEGGYRGKPRKGIKGYHSNNPFAGYQFVTAINAASPLAKNPQLTRGRKGTGRLIFRAWKENNGVANAAVIKAIEKTTKTFYRRTDN
jgi:hypothetical protein